MTREKQTMDKRLAPILIEMVDSGIPLKQALDVIESKIILTALGMTKGNKTRAALKLGVHRNTLSNKLKGRG